jgi:hypothetical protein
MNKRDDYVEKLKAQFDRWNADVREAFEKTRSHLQK